jgi:hypothetical protein
LPAAGADAEQILYESLKTTNAMRKSLLLEQYVEDRGAMEALARRCMALDASLRPAFEERQLQWERQQAMALAMPVLMPGRYGLKAVGPNGSVDNVELKDALRFSDALKETNGRPRTPEGVTPERMAAIAEKYDMRLKDAMQGLGKREQLEHCKAQRFPAAAPAAAGADSPAVRAIYAGADLEFGERIRAGIVYAPARKPGKNDPVEYRVSVAPEDGHVLRIERTKSSGLPDFDEAVRRAIVKAQPYGARMLGWRESMFWLVARPRESD